MEEQIIIDGKVEFSRETSSLGRNGYMRTSGIYLSVWKTQPILELYPLTSKGAPGRCYIQIPLQDIDQLINSLTAIRDGKL